MTEQIIAFVENSADIRSASAIFGIGRTNFVTNRKLKFTYYGLGGVCLQSMTAFGWKTSNWYSNVFTEGLKAAAFFNQTTTGNSSGF